MNTQHFKFQFLAGLFFALVSLNTHSEMLMLSVTGHDPTELQTTLYTPDGPGPHPLVVLNHGRSNGQGTDRHNQPRELFQSPASVFTKLGYVVAIPMRRGYAGSGSHGHLDGCDTEHMARGEAEDIKDALDVLVTRADVDPHQILLIGQSMGGLATTAFVAQYPDYPGIKGAINFAGGLKLPKCDWESQAIRTYSIFGKTAKVPMLWFYGENDSFWGSASGIPTQFYQAFVGSGAKAEFVPYGKWAADAHKLFYDWHSKDIWVPPVLNYLKRQGLPTHQ